MKILMQFACYNQSIQESMDQSTTPPKITTTEIIKKNTTNLADIVIEVWSMFEKYLQLDYELHYFKTFRTARSRDAHRIYTIEFYINKIDKVKPIYCSET